MKTNRAKLFGIIALVAIIGVTFAACNKGGSASGDVVKANPASDFEVKAIDGGQGVEITKYIGDKWEVGIPSKIRGLSVTSIGSNAFSSKSLIKVSIPNSVTTIEQGAFIANQLTSVTIPNSVTTIGWGAFYENQLTSVTIPDSVTTIGGSAFAENQLTSVTIGNSVTTIGEDAFAVNQLNSVTIGNSVITIGERAFASNKLTSVTIPDSVTYIGEYAFGGSRLTSITIGANVLLEEGVFASDGAMTFNFFDMKNYYYDNDVGFKETYNSNGKAAGTYTRPNTDSRTWTKQ